MTGDERLVEMARTAQDNAYAPYSGFKVGAALLAESGKVYVGCNVENAAYSATVCAERAALASAVTAGEKRFVAIAIVTPTSTPGPPCGVCRQALAEFGLDLKVIMAAALNSRCETVTLRELLPKAFVPRYLKERRGVRDART